MHPLGNTLQQLLLKNEVELSTLQIIINWVNIASLQSHNSLDPHSPLCQNKSRRSLVKNEDDYKTIERIEDGATVSLWESCKMAIQGDN